jgi:hypothetical protein
MHPNKLEEKRVRTNCFFFHCTLVHYLIVCMVYIYILVMHCLNSHIDRNQSVSVWRHVWGPSFQFLCRATVDYSEFLRDYRVNNCGRGPWPSFIENTKICSCCIYCSDLFHHICMHGILELYTTLQTAWYYICTHFQHIMSFQNQKFVLMHDIMSRFSVFSSGFVSA